MLPFRGGTLNKQVDFVQSTSSSDGMGGESETDIVLVVRLFASINPLKAMEISEWDQRGLQASHKLMCRYTALIKPSQRIVFGSRVFEIVSIKNIQERNIQLEIVVEEKQGVEIDYP